MSVIVAQEKQYRKTIERYKREVAELIKKAKGFEKLYATSTTKNDQFDLSDATLLVMGW